MNLDPDLKTLEGAFSQAKGLYPDPYCNIGCEEKNYPHNETFLYHSLGAIYKRRLLRGGGSQKYRPLRNKKLTKGEGGGHKIGKISRRCLWMAP